MKPSSRFVRVGASLLLAVFALSFIPAVSGKEKETREDKKARKTAEKALKKVQKKLKKALVAFSRAKDDETRSSIRDKLCEFLGEVIRIDHPVAADVLLDFTVGTDDDELYEFCSSGISAMASSKIPPHLLARMKEVKNKKLRVTWEQKVVILDVFREMSGVATYEATVLGLKDANPAIMKAALNIAGLKQDRTVIEALVGLLGRLEKGGGVSYFTARQALVDLTGEDYFTHAKWQGWWEANKGKFDFTQRGEATSAKTVERKEEEIPRFFGTEVQSNQCLFIIDVSGSMKMTDPPSEYAKPLTEYEMGQPDPKRQRIERAKAALAKVVATLQPTQRFNILRYSSAVTSWQGKDALVPATESYKNDGAGWIDAVREGGGTESYKVLQRAFGYPEVDTVYFLSDGAPSPARRGKPGDQQQQYEKDEIAKILSWVKRTNRFRRVKIYTFGFDGPGAWHKKWGKRSDWLPRDPKYVSHFRDFMSRLATVTGGEYRSLQ